MFHVPDRSQGRLHHRLDDGGLSFIHGQGRVRLGVQAIGVLLSGCLVLIDVAPTPLRPIRAEAECSRFLS